MDEYDDEENDPQPEERPEAPPAQPSFTQQATAPMFPSWSSDDDMRYARKAASLGQVRNDLDAGVLHPQYAAPLLNQLQGDLNSLSQQKQAADAFKQQSATHAAMNQMAVQQSVQVRNQQHAAEAFQSTIAHATGADGEVHEFYQAEPGKWRQVEKRQPTNGQPLTPEQTDAGGVVLPDGTTSYAPGNVPGATAMSEQRQMAGAQGPGGGGGPLTIQNGPYTEQYQDGQLVSSNRPAIEQNKMDGFTAAESQEVEQHAQLAVANMRPGVHRDVAMSHARLQAIAQISQRKAAQARVAETQRQEQVKADAVAAKANADLTGKQKADLFKSERKTLIDQINYHKKNTTDPAQVPDDLKDDKGQYLQGKALDDAARARADDLHRWATGGGQPAGQPSGQPAPAAPAAPAVKPLPPEKATLADVQAEMQRRAAANRPRPPAFTPGDMPQ